jgi:uncharacterized membrane protein YbjE (DUF340 family)
LLKISAGKSTWYWQARKKRLSLPDKNTKEMFTIIGIMLTGMLTGYLLRNKKLSWIHRIITLLIWLLLFLLGIDVGGNQAIIRGLHSIGLEAFIITLAAVAGSTLAAWVLWYFLYIRNKKDNAINPVRHDDANAMNGKEVQS